MSPSAAQRDGGQAAGLASAAATPPDFYIPATSSVLERQPRTLKVPVELRLLRGPGVPQLQQRDAPDDDRAALRVRFPRPVRGSRASPAAPRGNDGRSPAAEPGEAHIYRLDGARRETTLVFDPAPTRLGQDRAEWDLALAPGERATLFVTVACDVPEVDCRFLPNLRRAHRVRVRSSRHLAGVGTSNEIFNELLCRSVVDLVMLTTDTPQSPYPYAGIPWFSTAFGRDGIIMAIEMLAFAPELARGVLRLLAATQATAVGAVRDAEPGKILHETRCGEMAALGEVPFGSYYGSVDAPPCSCSSRACTGGAPAI